MNEPTLDVRPEVTTFVDLVRIYLGDLDDEVRDELTDGLEADMSDLVAERGLAALPDPEEYADELRTAAELPERVRHRLRRPRGSLRRWGRIRPESIGGWLDTARDRWLRVVRGGRLEPVWEALVATRPAWWVARGWLAVVALDRFTGPPESLQVLPQLGTPLLGPAVLVAAVVTSVQVGRRAWWPGNAAEASVNARVAVLALNLAGLAMVPATADGLDHLTDLRQIRYQGAPVPVTPARGVLNDGKRVENIFAYDATGRPLLGVQLFDQAGEPLSVSPRDAAWVNGSLKVWNVYPLPQREQRGPRTDDGAWTSDNPPTVPPAPMAGTAQVTLPGTDQESADSEKSGSR